MTDIRMPQTFKEWVTIAGIVGGLVPIVGGGWALSEMLHQGKEAYAQVIELKDDVKDLEQRYNKHIEQAWKKYKVEEAAKAQRAAKKGQGVEPSPSRGNDGVEIQDRPAIRE